MEALKDLIPKLLKASGEETLSEAQSYCKILTEDIDEVDPFVRKVETLYKAQDRLPTLRNAEEHTRRLAEMYIGQKWPLGEQEQALLRLLRQTMQQLEDSSGSFEARLGDETGRFASMVDKLVPKLRKSIREVREHLDDPIVGDADADMSRVNSLLDKQAKRLHELAEDAEQYAHWQEMLKQPVAEYDQLEEVQLDLGIKQKLWSGLRDWEGITATWVDSRLEQLDAQEMEKQVQTYLKTATKAERQLPGNQAAPKLRGMVMEFRTLTPAVQALRSPVLEEDHWTDISKALNIELDEESRANVTLGGLVNSGLVEKADEIQSVATRAAQEAALLELYDKKVESVWSELELPVLPYKESKDVFILGGPDDVYAALDESLVTLSTIMASPFVGRIRERVEKSQKLLRVLSDTLDEWLVC